MENLNAEKVKRGLQCCSNNDECVGEACPYYTTGCEKNMPKDALALINSQEQRIKELTEENERLRKSRSILAPIRGFTADEIDQIAKEMLEGDNEN